MRKSPNFWSSKQNRIDCVLQIAGAKQFKCQEDWYQVYKRDFPSALLHKYKSYVDIIKEAYPDYELLGWKFSRVPDGFWGDQVNRRKYVEWLCKEVKGFSQFADWYSISAMDFKNNYGGGLLASRYDNCPANAIKDTFPEYNWLDWLFLISPRYIWDDGNTRRSFMEHFANKFNLMKPEDWYSIKHSDFIESGGIGLLNYSKSMLNAIKTYIPDFAWEEWRFATIPNDFWHSIDNRRRYLDYLAELLELKSYDDWYSVMLKDFVNNGASRLVNRFGSIYGVISNTITDVVWDERKFIKGKKMQVRIYKMMKDAFPKCKILFDYLHDDLRFDKSGKMMQLDIFMPEFKVAIEYQDKSHFMPVERYGGDLTFEGVLARDAEKKHACSLHGIKLIELTYKQSITKKFLAECIEQYIK